MNYLLDTNCGLTQVLAELNADGTLKTWYTRGQELISLERPNEIRYYIYDGHGSTRLLTDENCSVTDTYSYDAFGNLTEKTGTTENSYLYCGEQFDGTTGLYYLRARYMNPSTGTFITMDEYSGSIYDPMSLHKYLYANANPVMYCDPSGNATETITEIVSVTFVMIIPQVQVFSQEVQYNAAVTKTGIQLIKMIHAIFWGMVLSEVLIPDSLIRDICNGDSKAPANDIKENVIENTLTDVKVDTTSKKDDNKKNVYFHATCSSNAISIIREGVLKPRSWEMVCAWRRMPTRKALNLSGAESAEVIIKFETNSAFEVDAGIINKSVDSDYRDYLKKFDPVRACFYGNVKISNPEIVPIGKWWEFWK